LTKYLFSNGQVIADESAFAPTMKKPDQGMSLSVLLILQRPWESAANSNQEGNDHEASES
jgi:hypothetical protein